ncbi:MAG: hypothetical protein OEW60_01505, partial [Thiovulaceae bacterium]|nr:hypothetical protein [Sulfurimonadaceae bacterium]
QLILTNHRLSQEPHNNALTNIRILLLETLITSFNHIINSNGLIALRGLEKKLVLKLISDLYYSEIKKNDFNFYKGDMTINVKFFLATLLERLCQTEGLEKNLNHKLPKLVA